MINTVRKWMDRYFAEEEAVILLLLLALGLLLIATLGDVLTPLIAAAVLAFMIQGLVGWLARRGVPEPLALGLAFAVFTGIFLVFFLVLLPLVWNQLRGLMTDLPGMLESLRQAVMQLRDTYPQFISEAQIRDVMERSSRDLAGLGQAALSFSLAYLPGVFGLAIYVVIVPLLLGFLVGVSVVIPYVGAVVVTVPVAVVAWFQWGWTPMFGYLMLTYVVIQAIDGNVLVPMLFSEANNLHPVAIILAVLVFGSIWGVWGAFFAIPLATLVKATMSAWPRSHAAVPAPDAPQ